MPLVDSDSEDKGNDDAEITHAPDPVVRWAEDLEERKQKIEELENVLHNVKLENESLRNNISSMKKFKPLTITFIILTVIFLALFVVWMIGKNNL